jgi:hypothetical protein
VVAATAHAAAALPMGFRLSSTNSNSTFSDVIHNSSNTNTNSMHDHHEEDATIDNDTNKGNVDKDEHSKDGVGLITKNKMRSDDQSSNDLKIPKPYLADEYHSRLVDYPVSLPSLTPQMMVSFL